MSCHFQKQETVDGLESHLDNILKECSYYWLFSQLISDFRGLAGQFSQQEECYTKSPHYKHAVQKTLVIISEAGPDEISKNCTIQHF